MIWDSESKLFCGTVYGGKKGHASFKIYQNGSKSLAGAIAMGGRMVRPPVCPNTGKTERQEPLAAMGSSPAKEWIRTYV